MRAADFKNEALSDFNSNAEHRRRMAEAIEEARRELGREYPLVIGGERIKTDEKLISSNPAQKGQVVGTFSKASRELAERAIQQADRAFTTWSRTPAVHRARLLTETARVLRDRKYYYAAWMVFEVGKSWAEADADVAEAIDFCEYYSREMLRLDQPPALVPMAGEKNYLRYIPLGVGVVIPPWNFPLAIVPYKPQSPTRNSRIATLTQISNLLSTVRLRIEARILVQQSALFRRHRNALQFLTSAAELRNPCFPFRPELLLEFHAQPLRERGTQPAGGNRDLQFTAAHHGGEVEIAALRFVDRVAQNASACGPRHRYHRATWANWSPRLPEKSRRNPRAGTRELAIRYGRHATSRRHSRCRFRRDNQHGGASRQQALDLRLADGACADDEHPPPFEFHEHGK